MFKLTLDEGLRTYLNSVPEAIYYYQVNGMPDGQKAFIARKSGSVLDPRWELRLEKHGVSSDWAGSYKTADEALGVLEKEVDAAA
jgi:hypothetical protein